MVPPMDEFYDKYKYMSHHDLYQMLHHGSVRQVEGITDGWASVASNLGSLAAELRQDLERLTRGWSGTAGDEFSERMGRLVRHIQTLADDAASVRTGLSTMAQALAEAQRRAEPPQPVAPPVVAAPSPVLGQELGRSFTPQEAATARERMVRLIAELAAHYGLAAHTNWPAFVPDPLTAAVGAIIDPFRRDDHDHHRDRDHHDRDHRQGTSLQGPTGRHHHVGHHGISLNPSHGPMNEPPVTQLRGAAGLGFAPSLSVLASGGSGPGGGSGAGTGGATSGGVGGGGGSGSGSSAGPAGGPGSAGGGPVSTVGGHSAAMAGGSLSMGGADGTVPPPVGLGTTGAGGAGGGAAGAVQGSTGGDVSWRGPDNLEWMDTDDDAAPSVIGE